MKSAGIAGVPRLLLGVDDAADSLGIRRTKMYELLASGVIPTIRIGRRRLVAVSALEAYVEQRLRERV